MALLTASVLGTTISASEAGYGGALTCVSSDTDVALITPASALGPTATFTIVGITTGYINATVSDANGQQIVLANIAVTPTPSTLLVSPTQLTFADNQESAQIAVVLSGEAPYTVVSSNNAIASAVIAGQVVLITPTGIGTTTITVVDALDNLGTVTVSVVSNVPSFQEALVGYLGATSGSVPEIIFNDLQIQASYPAVELNPQEIGGVWADIREVSGVLWLTRNATFNTATLVWGFVNSSQNAFALALAANGTVTWYECAAGTNPFVWIALWTFDALGNLSGAIGTVLTSSAQIANLFSPTWNTAGGTPMIGRRINVDDVSSPTASLLDDLQIDGASVWSVRKDGLLVAGKVPESALVDAGGNPIVLPQGGTSGPFPFDGSGGPQTITVASPYPTAITQVTLTPRCPAGKGPFPLVANTVEGTYTPSEFQFYVTGGSPGLTGDVDWTTIGD